jgi:hypothetical protein
MMMGASAVLKGNEYAQREKYCFVGKQNRGIKSKQIKRVDEVGDSGWERTCQKTQIEVDLVPHAEFGENPSERTLRLGSPDGNSLTSFTLRRVVRFEWDGKEI